MGRASMTTAGFPLSQTDALGQSTVNAYAPGSNLLLSTIDTLGRGTRYTYDAQGDVTNLTDPAGTRSTRPPAPSPTPSATGRRSSTRSAPGPRSPTTRQGK